jgi:hypothetical protein
VSGAIAGVSGLAKARRYGFTFAILVLGLLLGMSLPACADSPATLSFAPDQLPAGQAGTAYRVTIGVSGNRTPVFQMTVAAGELPRGLKLKQVSGTDTALLSGTPREAGSFPFTVRASCLGTNTSGQSGEHAYVLVVD